MKKILSLTILLSCFSLHGQLKILLDDFEGFTTGNNDLKPNGLYSYGNLEASVDNKVCTGQTYSGKYALKVQKKDNQQFGGWGKGVTLYMNLDESTDCFNFYFYRP